MVKEERVRGGLAIAIIAIVCAEVLSRISDAGFLQDGHVSRLLKILLYATSVLGYPALFFLLGMSTLACLQRSRAALLKSSAVGVLYPYLLWSILQMGVQWLVAGHQDDVGQQFEWVRLATASVGQFWFLYALFVCQIVAWFTVWPKLTTGRYVLTVANRCLLVAIVLVGGAVAIQSRWGIVTMTCRGLVFFLSGVLLASRSHRQSRHDSRPVVKLVVTLLVTIVFAAAATIGQRSGRYLDLYSVLTSFLGIAAAIQVGGLLTKWRSARWIVSIGSSWRPVYLLHVLATAVIWNGLLAVGISQPVIHFVLGSAAGLIVPVAIHLMFNRSGIAGWVGFNEPTMRQTDGGQFSDVTAQNPGKASTRA